MFSKFNDFKSLVENQTRKRIKVHRLDNREYTFKELDFVGKDTVIKRKLTVP